ncbi:MAG TPA: SCO family protein [Pyrinomonadaceae bacterium]
MLVKCGAALLICVIGVSVFGQSTMDQMPNHDHKHVTASQLASDSNATELVKKPGTVTVGTVQIPIPDLVVLDQNGTQKHFYSDLIKDKVVVLSFFFTSCVSVCPAMSVALTKLQTNLGDKLGKDVFIITVTKDPETDTPAKLREWGNKVGVKPGWTMVTGETKVIEKLVRDFTGDPLGRGLHNTVFILGSDKTGEWTDLHEFTSADELRQQVDLLSKPVTVSDLH